MQNKQKSKANPHKYKYSRSNKTTDTTKSKICNKHMLICSKNDKNELAVVAIFVCSKIILVFVKGWLQIFVLCGCIPLRKSWEILRNPVESLLFLWISWCFTWGIQGNLGNHEESAGCRLYFLKGCSHVVGNCAFESGIIMCLIHWTWGSPGDLENCLCSVRLFFYICWGICNFTAES